MLLKNSIEFDHKHVVSFSQEIDYSSCNIILEDFSDSRILNSLIAEGADFIIVGTEFITGESFNHFPGNSDYGRTDLWKKRYDSLVTAAESARAIWFVSETNIDEYIKKFGEKVILFPMTHVPSLKQFDYNTNSDKDIDILFSGTLTSYRKKILSSLETSGFNVIQMPITTPSYIRNDFCKRVKLSLNLRHSENWKYSSPMRYHYHIMNRIPLLGQKCELEDRLTEYVVNADYHNFTETCHRLIENNGKECIEKYHEFAEEMQCKDYIPEVLDKTMSLPHSKQPSIMSYNKNSWLEIALDREREHFFYELSERYSFLQWTRIAIKKWLKKFFLLFLKKSSYDILRVVTTRMRIKLSGDSGR